MKHFRVVSDFLSLLKKRSMAVSGGDEAFGRNILHNYQLDNSVTTLPKGTQGWKHIALSGVIEIVNAVDLIKFQAASKSYILDTRSLLCLELDEVASKLLSMIQFRDDEPIMGHIDFKHWSHDIWTAVGELNALKKAGLLSTEEHFGPDEVPTVPTHIYSLAMPLSSTCNLACRYCLADRGAYHSGSSKPMSLEVAKASVDFLLRESGEEDPVWLIFTGGEPLLRLEFLKSIVNYANARAIKAGKRFAYGIATNGTLLSSDAVDFLCRSGFKVTVSIDGPHHMHDEMRPLTNGTGSHDLVVAGVTRLRSKMEFTAQAVITSSNAHLVEEIIAYLLSLGATRVELLKVIAPDSPMELSEEDNRAYLNCLREIASAFLEDPRTRYLQPGVFIRTLRRLYSMQPKHYSCGAGIHFLSVSPIGELYPCIWLLNLPQWRMGTVFEPFDYDQRLPYLVNHVDAKLHCRNCWARHICGGECLGSSAIRYGSIVPMDSRTCDMIREFVEICLNLLVQLDAQDRQFLRQLCCHSTGGEEDALE
jgi:uncharacterized protein